MLKIIYSLQPFLEDNYKRIHVRAYARNQNISPPTASKLLNDYEKQGLLKKELYEQYIYYVANKSSDLFVDFQRIYFKIKLKQIGFVDYIEKQTFNPVIILFGSIAKAEAKINSDIDIAIVTTSEIDVDITNFQKEMKREIHIFTYKQLSHISEELKLNILNGYIIHGKW
jgi:predicted nucleotidyltransferase